MDEMKMVETMERLSAAAVALEQAVERMSARQESLAAEAEETVGRIVATVETAREAELEKKLAEAEKKIAEMSAAAGASVSAGRKTVPGGVARMFAKDEGVEVGAIDGALTSLSVEQRIAVKAALMRAGMVG
jgi:F0F1-type ATP synthase membrane subunit b/b'